MLIRYLYYSSFIFLSLAYSYQESFQTEIGVCHLNIKKSNNDLGLKKQIQLWSKNLVIQFGSVKKTDFFINIIDNKEQLKNFPNWASGIAINNRVFIYRNKLSPTVVSHELCHIFQNKIKNSKTFPAWFKEGMAMHFSKDFFDIEITTLSESILLDYVIELDQLHNISKLKNPKDVKVAYQESLYAYQKIVNEYSPASIKKIIYQMNNNDFTFSKAFKNVLGIKLKDFTSKTDEEIKKTSATHLFFNLPSFLFFISSIIIFIIFIYIKRRNKKIVKKWELEDELELLDENNTDNNSN